MPTARDQEAARLAYWLLGALLLALMSIIGITHSMVMDRFDSLERRLERLESDKP